MATETVEITARNWIEPDEIYGLLVAINDRLVLMEERLTRLARGYSSGGMKGLRSAARDV